MLFTIGAHVLDTVLVKTTAFVVAQSVNLLCWTTSSLYYTVATKPLSETEKLKLQINELKTEVELLKVSNCQSPPSENNNYNVIALS